MNALRRGLRILVLGISAFLPGLQILVGMRDDQTATGSVYVF